MSKSVEDLGKRRDELRQELSEVEQEIRTRHGEVDDPSDRDASIPVPGRDKSGPPPDPRPDPEVDPETGRAKGDEPRDIDLPEGVGESRDDEGQVSTATNKAPVRTGVKSTAAKRK